MLANPFAHGKIIHLLSNLLPLVTAFLAEPQKLAAHAKPDLLATGREAGTKEVSPAL